MGGVGAITCAWRSVAKEEKQTSNANKNLDRIMAIPYSTISLPASVLTLRLSAG
jgi:hypothetical protein